MKSRINLPLIVVIITLLVFVVASVPLVGGNVPFEEKWSNTIEAIAVTVALVISGLALLYAVLEYNQHKKIEKTTLLCQYLQRYASDPIIRKVTEYILDTALLDEKGNKIVGFDESKTSKNTPTLTEKEMFMRFFEEIQLLIEDKLLDGDKAIYLMGYYCDVYHRIDEYHGDISDYNDEETWGTFLKFANSIPEGFENYLKKTKRRQFETIRRLLDKLHIHI